MTFNHQHDKQQETGDDKIDQGAAQQERGHAHAETFGAAHSQYRQRLLCSMVGMLRDREKAEDVTATAFQRAFVNRGRFRGQSSFYTWLHTIATNEAKSLWKREKTVSLEAIEGSVSDNVAAPDFFLETQERLDQAARIRKALDQLPTIHRQILLDHFVDGQSVKRIARTLRIPVGTVLSRIFTAKRLLRRAWEAVT